MQKGCSRLQIISMRFDIYIYICGIYIHINNLASFIYYYYYYIKLPVRNDGSDFN